MRQVRNDYPEWYWVHGLHDAKILSAAIKGPKWNPDENCLTIELNCDAAMFEADITEIRFYNCKVKTEDFDFDLLQGGWWLSDELLKKGDHYLFELEFDTEACKRKYLKMTFDDAEVFREKPDNRKHLSGHFRR